MGFLEMTHKCDFTKALRSILLWRNVLRRADELSDLTKTSAEQSHNYLVGLVGKLVT